MLGKVEIELFSIFCSHALVLALLYMFLLLVVEGEWEKELPLLGFLIQQEKGGSFICFWLCFPWVSLRGWFDCCGELLVVFLG